MTDKRGVRGTKPNAALTYEESQELVAQARLKAQALGNDDAVWRLKVQGNSMEHIAAVTRQTVEQVSDAIERKANARRNSVAQTLDVEGLLSLDRLDAMLLALAEKVNDGEVSAIKVAKDIDESRRKLLGLDAARITASISVDGTAEMDVTKLSADELKEYLRLTSKMAKALPPPKDVLDVSPEE